MGNSQKQRNIIPIVWSIILIFALTSCSSGTALNENPSSSSQVEKQNSAKDKVESNSMNPVNLKGEKPKLSCSNLVSIQELYDFNPNFAIDESLQPISPEIADTFATVNGLSCMFINLTSGDEIQTDLAVLTDPSVKLVEAEFSKSGGTPLSDNSDLDSSSFVIKDGVGILQILKGNFWLSVSSSLFLSPEEAFVFILPILKKF